MPKILKPRKLQVVPVTTNRRNTINKNRKPSTDKQKKNNIKPSGKTNVHSIPAESIADNADEDGIEENGTINFLVDNSTVTECQDKFIFTMFV